MFGDRMVAVALSFAVLGIGGSASDVGLVLAARSLPLVASLLVGGVVADRVSRRAVMVTTDLVRLGSQGLAAVLLIAGSADVWSLALLSGVSGAATGFFNPAATGLLPAIVAPEDLQPANGLRATAMSAGEILGPALAGIVVATAGAGWALAIDAATFAASAAFLVRLTIPRLERRAATSFVADLREGWGEFISRTWVWTFVAASAFGNLMWCSWSALGPIVAHRDLGGAAAWGTVLAGMGVGALVGGLLAVRARPRRPLMRASLTLVLIASPLALLAAGAPLALLVVGAFLAGIAMMVGNSLWESTLQRHAPPEALSRLSAYDWFGSLALQPVGLAMWGPIAGAIGLSPALWLSSSLITVSTLAVLAVPAVRDVTDEPVRA